MARGSLELILAMVIPKGHAPTIKRSTWGTMDAAVEHIHTLAKEYPNTQDVLVIVDDL